MQIEETNNQDRDDRIDEEGSVICDSQNQSQVSNDEPDDLVEETTKTIPKTRKEFFSPKRGVIKRRNTGNQEDPRVIEAYGILKGISSKTADKDECSAHADFIACKLRKFDDRTRAIVMHNINDVLFNAEIGKYNEITTRQPSYHHNLSSPLLYSSESSRNSQQYAQLLQPVSPSPLLSPSESSHNNSQQYNIIELSSQPHTNENTSTLQSFISTFTDTTN